jgi:hypothetical protein
MENYEYQVVDIIVEVTTGDIEKKVAGKKVANQVEIILKDYVKDGWEYYNMIPVEVKVKGGCFSKTDVGTQNLYLMVFRRSVK